MPRPLALLLLPAIGLLSVLTFLWVGPATGFRDPEAARIIIFHLPWAFVASAGFIWLVVCAARVLWSKSGSDAATVAAAEVSLLYSVNTMVSGIVFSKTQWGAWWQWDNRQTSFAVLLLILAAYFALRGAIEDPERRARLSAVYALLGGVASLFLTWVLPRVTATFHPTTTVQRGEMSADYRITYLLMTLALGLLFVWLYNMRRQIAERETAPVNVEPGGAVPVIRPLR
jgi:heme exporter protein C